MNRDEIYRARDFIPLQKFPRTCYSCDWSHDTINGLFCKKFMCGARAVCPHHFKASGADEPEEVND